MDESVFKTYYPSVRAARGPGPQSATAFEVLITPVGLSDLHETHQEARALLWAPSLCLVSVSWLDLGPGL